MKTNENYILREIDGESILIPIGEASEHLNGMIHLTPTAAFIWKEVDNSNCLEEIIQKLMGKYEVTEEIARRDIYGFLSEFYKRQMVLEIPEFENNTEILEK
ncbi:PqqD family protein [Phocaeicola coprocola]|uniref:PqqD family protein n=1 Tax=Phocaeicola coprocola TaxID=310298 RepID=UPI0032BFBAB9